MPENSAKSFLASMTILLLVWLSLGPVVASALSFIHALPTFWPAVGYFSQSPVHWRPLFFVAGCLALTSAFFISKRQIMSALVCTACFAALYVPVFPLVWGQKAISLWTAGAAVVLNICLRLWPKQNEA